MTNPSARWDTIPVYGAWFKDETTPAAGKIRFTLTQRINRVDGRVIFPEGAVVERTIGDTDGDAAIRDAVRAAWLAEDQAKPGFDQVSWDAWWNTFVSGAIFASFPASDDPDIVQTGYQVKVEEKLNSGQGKVYYIQPLLAHLEQTPPGINLGLIEVPPGAPTAPAPIYAKGLPGGVASLDAAGVVPFEQLPPDIGGGLDDTGIAALVPGSSATGVALRAAFVTPIGTPDNPVTDPNHPRPAGIVIAYWVCAAGVTPNNAADADLIWNADA